MAVCEERNLTRAAAREAIAPSAVSKRLAELELNLGTTLFERKPSGMELTPAGDTLFHHARRLVLNAEQIVAEMAEHARGVRGFVRMLANLGAIVQFLPEDLQSFMAAHPAIRIDLEERPSDGVVAGVRDGSAEVGICSADVEAGGLRRRLYRSERLLVVMRTDHPLSGHDGIAFVDTLEHDHVGLHEATSINQRSILEARLAGKSLRMRIHVPSFDAVCRMAQAGMGVSIVPERAFELLGKPMGLIARPLADAWGRRELHIVSRPQSLSALATLLVAHLIADRSSPETSFS